MTDDEDGLFRDEALEHHVRRRGAGELLQGSSTFVDRLYVVFLVLVAVGTVVLLVAR